MTAATKAHTFKMTVDLRTLDAHEQPTGELKSTWKTYSKTDHADFLNHPDIDDLLLQNMYNENDTYTC